jgi:hypothetical protein
MGLVKVGNVILAAEQVSSVNQHDGERVLIEMISGSTFLLTREGYGRVPHADAVATTINEGLDVHRIVNALREVVWRLEEVTGTVRTMGQSLRHRL